MPRLSSQTSGGAKRSATPYRLALLCGAFIAAAGGGLYLAVPEVLSLQGGATLTKTAAPQEARADRDECEQQAWPYIDHRCLKGAAAREGARRQVRVISTDPDAPTSLIITMAPSENARTTMATAGISAGDAAARGQSGSALGNSIAPSEDARAIEPSAGAVSGVAQPQLPSPTTSGSAEATSATEDKDTTIAKLETSPPDPIGATESIQSADPAASFVPSTSSVIPMPTIPPAETEGRSVDVTLTSESGNASAAPKRPASKTASLRREDRAPGSSVRDEDESTARAKPAKPVKSKPVASNTRTAQTARSRGPGTLVRTYDFADGRRITVYKKLTASETERVFTSRDFDRPFRENFHGPVARRLSAYLD